MKRNHTSKVLLSIAFLLSAVGVALADGETAPGRDPKQPSDDATTGLHLPAPGGSFGIGRVTYYWTDLARPEPFSAQAGAHREVVVYVWYPTAAVTGNTNRAPYFPDFPAAKATISEEDFNDMLRPATESVRKNGLPTTHATEVADMSKGKERYPVIIFSHGWGLQCSLYTAALEDLASRGYVVVAIDHPYDTTVNIFPDGHVVKFAQDRFDAATKKEHGFIDYAHERTEVMARDIPFVIDELIRYDKTPKLGAPFAGHLKLDSIGAFGHSVGGMTSARACQLDPRLQACIDEDSTDDMGSPFSVITAGSIPKQPFLLFVAVSADIFSEKALHPSEESLQQQKLSRAQYDEIIQRQQRKQNELLAGVAGGAYRVMLFDLPGFTHRSFSDLHLLAAGQDQSKWNEALYNFQTAQTYILAFFDKYLKGVPNTALDAKSPRDARIRVDRFVPAKDK